MHGSAPDAFAHDGWTNIRMYALAAEEAGSTETDAIIDAQPGIEFEAPMGPTRYREGDHQAIHPVSIGEIVEPADYDWPSMDVLQTVSSEDAIQPCSEVGCEF
jgi:branched-chain amino acid transport system substrate-binding protein